MDDRVTAFLNRRVTAVSPDRSVKTFFSHREGFGIELHPTLARRHTESSLARQVSLAISGVRNGYTEAVRRTLPSTTATAAEAEHARLRQRRTATCADIAVTVTSPLRYAKVTITGTGAVTCVIRPKALSRDRVELSELARDIRDAYREAQADHKRQLRDVDLSLIKQALLENEK